MTSGPRHACGRNFIPEREIFHCRQQAGRADRIEVRVGDLNPGLPSRHSFVGDIPDNFGIVVAERTRVVRMPSGSKIRAEVKRHRATGCADHLHDLGQQGITRVAIEVLAHPAGSSRSCCAGDDDREHCRGIGDRCPWRCASRRGQQLPLIAQATRYGAAEAPEGKIGARNQAGRAMDYTTIIKRQFSFGRQVTRYGKRRVNCLGSRCRMKDGMTARSRCRSPIGDGVIPAYG